VRARTAPAVLAAFALAAAAQAAPPPRLVNARVETRSAAGGLQDAVQRILAGAGQGPVWIGYAVPVDGGRSMCCWESVDSMSSVRCPGCRLEGKGSFTFGSAPDENGVNLEADETFLVLLRAEAGRIGKVRTVSFSCALDAGGLPVFWLDDVRPADSVRLLGALIEDRAASRHLLDGALLALASHAEPSALDRLIAAARRDSSSQVREKALFWLSQKAGQRATAAIARAVDEDPESQVRQRAVFALSQLPRDEGVPRLITLARGHRDPRVREKALFWLGQSGDPRALALFEEILRR
jgi:hypothetical protein